MRCSGLPNLHSEYGRQYVSEFHDSTIKIKWLEMDGPDGQRKAIFVNLLTFCLSLGECIWEMKNKAERHKRNWGWVGVKHCACSTPDTGSESESQLPFWEPIYVFYVTHLPWFYWYVCEWFSKFQNYEHFDYGLLDCTKLIVIGWNENHYLRSYNLTSDANSITKTAPKWNEIPLLRLSFVHFIVMTVVIHWLFIILILFRQQNTRMYQIIHS